MQTGITNARTEGYNRLVKQVKREGCGFRNRALATPDTIPLHANSWPPADFTPIARPKLRAASRPPEQYRGVSDILVQRGRRVIHRPWWDG